MNNIVHVEDFDFNILAALPDLPRGSGNQRTRQKLRYYKAAVCAFDTETSYIEQIDRQTLYIWQFQIDEALTVIGRTWSAFLTFWQTACDILEEQDKYIVVYVHNLSYEFQFMRSLFHVDPDDLFCVKSRRVLRWICGRFEFRCSYLQTNMSLDAFTHKFGVKHSKLSGEEFDYKKVRYSDTPLSDRELEYCVNDVRGLVEALKAEMARDDDTLYTIPLTSTGYVRREVKAALRQWGRHRLAELMPGREVYQLLREAFRGGNTHANRYFVKNPEYPLPPVEDVHSADRSSSYPDVQVNYMFPMSPFKRVLTDVTYSRLKDHYIKRRGYALLFRLEINDLRLRDKFNPCPYISLDKCHRISGKQTDNGRILKADHVSITVTDIDFNIIDKQYVLSDANVTISDLHFARYDYLPDELRELVKHFYSEKTALKGVAGMALFYDKFKNLINAVYGCSAQDPGKDTIIYNENPTDENGLYTYEGKDLDDILYHARPSQPYQWGVWTTARARERLQIMIDAVHENPDSEFVYTDTDSVKYIGAFDLESINAQLRQISIEHGAYADDVHGNRHYMGVYEFEGTYKRFETLGAKSYVYEDDSGDLHITIAGVPKKAGARELVKMACGEFIKGCAPVEDFKTEINTRAFKYYQIGTVFHDGVTETHYNDERQFKRMTVDGHVIELTSDLIIRDSFHKIGFASDYKILLENLTHDDIENIRKRC